MDSKTYAVEVFGLDKHFELRQGLFRKKTITVLNNVFLQIKRGEIFGLLGPNGAGKTTLIKILSGLIIPDKGKGHINGISLDQASGFLPSIGLIVTDENSFYGRLSARQNLAFFGSLQKVPRRILKKRIAELLDLFKLSDFSDTWVQKFSSGMKQRLCLARGLLHDPEILLMDEPTRSLDPLATSELWLFIKESLVGKQKKTIFLTTLKFQEAEEICDRLAILVKGAIVKVGITKEVLSRKEDILEIFRQQSNKGTSV